MLPYWNASSIKIRCTEVHLPNGNGLWWWWRLGDAPLKGSFEKTPCFQAANCAFEALGSVCGGANAAVIPAVKMAGVMEEGNAVILDIIIGRSAPARGGSQPNAT